VANKRSGRPRQYGATIARALRVACLRVLSLSEPLPTGRRTVLASLKSTWCLTVVTAVRASIRPPYLQWMLPAVGQSVLEYGEKARSMSVELSTGCSNAYPFPPKAGWIQIVVVSSSTTIFTRLGGLSAASDYLYQVSLLQKER